MKQNNLHNYFKKISNILQQHKLLKPYSWLFEKSTILDILTNIPTDYKKIYNKAEITLSKFYNTYQRVNSKKKIQYLVIHTRYKNKNCFFYLNKKNRQFLSELCKLKQEPKLTISYNFYKDIGYSCFYYGCDVVSTEFYSLDLKYNPSYNPLLKKLYIPSYILNSIINIVLVNLNKYIKELIPEWLPSDLLEGGAYINFFEALTEVHQKTTNIKYIQACKRLKTDELLLIMYNMRAQMDKSNNKNIIEVNKEGAINDILEIKNKLEEFQYSKSQLEVIDKITTSITTPIFNKDLLQGDVGSGKTLVALTLILSILKQDRTKQVVYLVPNIILAEQIYKQISHLSRDLMYVIPDLLIKAPRSQQLKDISSGETNVIIGTLTAQSKKISYKNLSYMIIDEQHKFGVAQRSKLYDKYKCQSLMMTATPIPRTLFIFQMQCSSLYKLKPRIKTKKHSIPISFDRIRVVLAHIRELLEEGKQVMIVCKEIEKRKKEVENIWHLDYVYELLSEFIDEIIILTGRNTEAEKLSGIKLFRTKERKILLSTTLIEVGVDIPECNDIIIFNANMYGLAQLHQLRGRVGRQGKQATVFLVDEHVETERLLLFSNCTDGNKLADYDIKVRGTGSIHGLEQSGNDKNIIYSFVKDKDIKVEYIHKYIQQLDPPKAELLNFFYNRTNQLQHIILS